MKNSNQTQFQDLTFFFFLVTNFITDPQGKIKRGDLNQFKIQDDHLRLNLRRRQRPQCALFRCGDLTLAADQHLCVLCDSDLGK